MDSISPPCQGSPYARLGLQPGAPLPEVKRAYRRLAMRFHPDRAGPEDLRTFLEVKCAYERILAGPMVAEPGDRRRGSGYRPSSVRRPSRERARAARTRPAAQNAGPAGPAAGGRWPGGQWYWEGVRERAARD